MAAFSLTNLGVNIDLDIIEGNTGLVFNCKHKEIEMPIIQQYILNSLDAGLTFLNCSAASKKVIARPLWMSLNGLPRSQSDEKW